MTPAPSPACAAPSVPPSPGTPGTGYRRARVCSLCSSASIPARAQRSSKCPIVIGLPSAWLARAAQTLSRARSAAFMSKVIRTYPSAGPRFFDASAMSQKISEESGEGVAIAVSTG